MHSIVGIQDRNIIIIIVRIDTWKDLIRIERDDKKKKVNAFPEQVFQVRLLDQYQCVCLLVCVDVVQSVTKHADRVICDKFELNLTLQEQFLTRAE